MSNFCNLEIDEEINDFEFPKASLTVFPLFTKAPK